MENYGERFISSPGSEPDNADPEPEAYGFSCGYAIIRNTGYRETNWSASTCGIRAWHTDRNKVLQF
ncbi:MAG TPA: hypothetical protein VMW77_10195 [Methanoregula sp.]|nr:hypothetical protein [Methanoregula sp.]